MTTTSTHRAGAAAEHRLLLIGFAAAVALPFVVAFVNGQAPTAVFSGEAGNAKFLQGLAIEIFVLALYALSYDLILGVTGLLSFGHAMFFAVGAYGSGVMMKSLEWPFPLVLVGLVVLAVLQAILFAIVLPRVRGITFALVTLGISSVFFIMIQSTELGRWTGADVGLQGVPSPSWIDTNTQRYRLYLLALVVLVAAYLLYRRILGSPTGAVLVANRENEDRTLMLGYNTFWYKLFALVVSSLTAVTAGLLWTLHQPIVTPQVASLGWTVAALLMILIGGVGTLSGAIVGAAVFRLLQYYLERWFGGASAVLLGMAYIAIVLFLPYGIVGTWRAKRIDGTLGRSRVFRLLTGDRS